jgi:hypothetical protein
MTRNPQAHFTKGLVTGVLGLGFLFLLMHLALFKAGEVNLDHIIGEQLSGGHKLFLSGINQNAYAYKLELLEKTKPEVVVIGSSRAMQFRDEFFQKQFLNLGGTVSNIADLEQLAAKINSLQTKPKLLLITLDPWWFNPNYIPARQPHLNIEFPNIVNADLMFNAVNTLGRGSWLTEMFVSDNLGIHAILSGEGFSVDGSYHYTATVTGEKISRDELFAGTLNRISNGNQRFEKSSVADADITNRACIAMNTLSKSSENLIVITPPFASTIWRKLNDGGYEYIQDVYNKLEACAGVTINNYSNPTVLEGATDCEFIDGFHGGDTIAARMLKKLNHDYTAELNTYINQVFLDQFINTYAGHAAGITTTKFTSKSEIDFLKLGCKKTSRSK